jgi:hypothetical protein
MIECKNIFECENSKELRGLAKEYYVNNIAKTTVFNKDIGTIYFPSKGYKKPVSFSGDVRKLILFPYIKEIMKNAKLVKTERDRKKQPNIFIWYIIESEVLLDEKIILVRINLKKDNRGNIYYDHFICE